MRNHTAQMREAEQASGDAGFTLIELLVALALLGLLMALVFGGLSFGTRAWEKSDAHLSGADTVRFAQALIRRDIALSYPMLVTKAPAQPTIAFDGDRQSLVMLTSGAKGRTRVTLALSQDGKGWSLSRTTQDELAAGGSDKVSAPRVLVDGAEFITFSYFGSATAGAPRQWNDSWSGATRPPELVRIEITFPPGDPRRWPELIVAPRIAADVGCRYDPASKYCIGR